jgi:hypothetical protein
MMYKKEAASIGAWKFPIFTIKEVFRLTLQAISQREKHFVWLSGGKRGVRSGLRPCRE